MLQECKDKHSFDLLKIPRDLGLDFLDTIKLVNYIRSEVKAGNKNPDVSTKHTLQFVDLASVTTTKIELMHHEGLGSSRLNLL